MSKVIEELHKEGGTTLFAGDSIDGSAGIFAIINDIHLVLEGILVFFDSFKLLVLMRFGECAKLLYPRAICWNPFIERLRPSKELLSVVILSVPVRLINSETDV
jgi:hypothetical protein